MKPIPVILAAPFLSVALVATTLGAADAQPDVRDHRKKAAEPARPSERVVVKRKKADDGAAAAEAAEAPIGQPKNLRDHRKDVRDHREDAREHREEAHEDGAEIRDHRQDDRTDRRELARKRAAIFAERMKSKKLDKKRRAMLERAHTVVMAHSEAREERRKAELDREEQRIAAMGRANTRVVISADLREELRRHARRTARLQRIMVLAAEAEDYASLERCDKLTDRENRRHEKWLERHAKQG